MVVTPYFPLTDDVLRKIIRLQLGHIQKRMRRNYRATFEYDESVIAAIASRCKEVESGARNVDHILTGSVLPDLSREFLARMAEGKQVQNARLHIGPDGNFLYDLL